MEGLEEETNVLYRIRLTVRSMEFGGITGQIVNNPMNWIHTNKVESAKFWLNMKIGLSDKISGC